jgi:hypothetical protein
VGNPISATMALEKLDNDEIPFNNFYGAVKKNGKQ